MTANAAEELDIHDSTGRRIPRPSRRQLQEVGVFIVAIAALKIVMVILNARHVIHAATPVPVLALGVITGMTYGLLGVGLVLVFRTNKIINFAHGYIGAFGAAFFSLSSSEWHLPYWVAFPAALVVAAAVGGIAEAGVVRRLRSAPLVMSVVATLGVGQILVIAAVTLNGIGTPGISFPEPSGLPTFQVGALFISPAYSAMLFLSPLVVVGLAVFLKVSRFGLAIRAASANPEAARMSGIFASRTSTMSWCIAGSLAAFVAILIAPTEGSTIQPSSFGPELILRALTAAVIGRMQSMPRAFLGGIAIGVVEQVLQSNYPNSGLVEMVLFVMVLVVLLGQRNRSGRSEEKGSWAAVQVLRPIPAQLQALPLVRWVPRAMGLFLLALLAFIPLVTSNSLSVTFSDTLCYVIVGLSVGILTGLGGQLTLGQFMVGAVGAVVSYKVSERIGDFPLALLYAGLAAGVVSVLIGLPSLRIRGQMLTVTTLAFALAGPQWLLVQSWALGGGQNPGAPVIHHHALDTGHSYYYFAYALFIICLLIARNIRSSGFGRLLVAIRDNEENARAFTIRASSVKMQGYLIAGFIAGIGGATYGHSLTSIDSTSFPDDFSITILIMTVLGGISVLSGPILGALVLFVLPLLPLGNLGLLATETGALLIILYRPGGIVSFFANPRLRLVSFIAKRFYGIDAAPYFEGTVVSDAPARSAAVREAQFSPSRHHQLTHGTTLLEARNLRKSFGGVTAVKDVSFTVRAGETLGLIGPNGAGKTTTFELLGGFTRPDSGQVTFNRRDITRLSPEGRAQLGLIRSFQDAALFPTLTVQECIMLSLERIQPTKLLTSVVGLSFGERKKQARALELIGLLGLDRYSDKQIQELSTGTRRITEIACLVALEPACLLLDEPSSGIAQRETEALGTLLNDLKRQLNLTLIIIEHDIPLIMGLSDRIVAMADGNVICTGTPDVVRADPMVIDAYLGGSITAIERSGTLIEGGAETAASNGHAGHLNGNGLALADELLIGIRGLGPGRRDKLLTAFGSSDALHGASVDELAAVDGVGRELATRVRQALDA